MLELKNIYKTFNPGTINEKVALNGVSLSLNDGDFVTVIGGNGAGKSTLLNAVAGTWFVDEGSILIDGNDVTKLPEHKRAVYLGPCFPGSDDRNRSHNGNSRKIWLSRSAVEDSTFSPFRDHEAGAGGIRFPARFPRSWS